MEQISGSFALVNGTVVDGTGSDPVTDGVVVIEGGRIVAVGAGDQVTIPADIPVVDVDGATILPGFVNAHVHAAFDEDNLEAWAHSGVTTVRDLGAWLDDGTGGVQLPPLVICPAWGCDDAASLFARRDELSNDARYARLVAAGPFISASREPGDGWLAVTSPQQAEPAINDLVDDGADLVKIYVEEPTSGYAPVQEAISATVKAAHARGVPASAHILIRTHLEYALEAGIDDLAHMIYDGLPEDLIARAIEQNVYWIPTLELAQCTGNLTATADNLRSFQQSGGNVALGTDFAGYRNCDFDLGMPMTEIELMLEADMTPMQIIVAATSNGAHVCGLDDQIGTLEADKIADILIVEGNPLDDMQALTDVQMVIHNGVVIRDE
jgi:imidazolonepropionase-like amidohydrolase